MAQSLEWCFGRCSDWVCHFSPSYQTLLFFCTWCIRCMCREILFMPKFPKLCVSYDIISGLGGSCSLVRMCVAFFMKLTQSKRLFLSSLVKVWGQKGHGRMRHGKVCWNLLIVMLIWPLMSAIFFLPLLSHPFSYITQTGYVWTLIINSPNLSFSVKTQCK